MIQIDLTEREAHQLYLSAVFAYKAVNELVADKGADYRLHVVDIPAGQLRECIAQSLYLLADFANQESISKIPRKDKYESV